MGTVTILNEFEHTFLPTHTKNRKISYATENGGFNSDLVSYVAMPSNMEL